MMWMWHSGWGWFWMSVMMVVFSALVAWVIVTLVRQGDRGGRGTTDAQGLLEERFARGDMSRGRFASARAGIACAWVGAGLRVRGSPWRAVISGLRAISGRSGGCRCSHPG